MRILHITDRLSQRGGADWHLLGVLGWQAKQPDIDVQLAVGRVDGSVQAPCPVHVHNGLDSLQRHNVQPRLDALAQESQPDIIHVHNALNPLLLHWACQRGAVMTVQDHRVFCPGRGKLTNAGESCREPMDPALCTSCLDHPSYGAELFGRTEERLLAVRQMAAVTVLSHYMKQQLVAVGVSKDRISVIPPLLHGLDETARPNGSPCVLFAGRLASAKGVDDAMAAWQSSGVCLPLVFAGTGPARARLEAAGAEVLGWVPHHEMSNVYARARVLVMPSRWQEPFGIVGPEALSMGIPVAAWHSGGVAEWHPGGELLVPWGDVAALGRALVLAVVNPPVVSPPVLAPGPLMAALQRVYSL